MKPTQTSDLTPEQMSKALELAKKALGITDTCPACGSKLSSNGSSLSCSNGSCRINNATAVDLYQQYGGVNRDGAERKVMESLNGPAPTSKKGQGSAKAIDQASSTASNVTSSLAAGLINLLSNFMGIITTGVIEISVIVMDALLSAGNRGFQALAGVSASMGYYVSLQYTWYLMASIDPNSGLAPIMGLAIESAKVVLSYCGWGAPDTYDAEGKPKSRAYIKTLAIVAITMSIFATMAYTKNVNNEIRMQASKGTDKYLAEQVQRESLISELEGIDSRIARAEDAATNAADSVDSTATKASTADPDKLALAQKAQKAKDDQADQIQAALDAKLASYSPDWLAKNASAVSGWKETARVDIANLRAAGVKAYQDALGHTVSYEQAKATAQADATRLEQEAQKLRDRKAELMVQIGESAQQANAAELITRGYLSVFDWPEGDEIGEMIVSLLFAVFLEMFNAAMVKAYKEFGAENSDLYIGAQHFASMLRDVILSGRTPNYAPSMSAGTDIHNVEGSAGLVAGYGDTNVVGAGPSLYRGENEKPAGFSPLSVRLDKPTQTVDVARRAGFGQIDLADVRRFAEHLAKHAEPNKAGDRMVAPGIRAAAAALKMNTETAKHAHYYLKQHGKLEADEQARKTYLVI